MRVGESYLQYREGRHNHWILTFCVTVMVTSIGSGSPSTNVCHEVWFFIMFLVRINVLLKWKAQGVRFRNCSLRILCYIIGGKLILNIVLDMERTYSYVGYLKSAPRVARFAAVQKRSIIICTSQNQRFSTYGSRLCFEWATKQ